MRVDLETGTAPSSAPGAERPARRRGPGLGLDRVELALLLAFGAISMWVLALDLWRELVGNRVWTGTDGVYIVDQMQYLAWIRSAAHHVLVSNMFVLRPTSADYFQPAVVLSGALVALGVAPMLSLLLWKPVAVLALFFAIRSYVHHTLDGVAARRAAIALALFFGSFTSVYGSLGVIGDLFPGFLSWGYEFGLLALAALVAALVYYERAREEQRLAWAPGLLGALASLLHPWHGELLIVIILAAEGLVWLGRRPTRRQLGLLALTLGLSAAPLFYYMLLGRFDLSWKLARVASKHQFALWSIVLALVPLLIPAVLTLRRRPARFLAATTWSWPFAAVAVFVVSATGLSATPLHAFQGITIPLGVLAVAGVSRRPFTRLPYRPILACLVIAVLTIPATVYELNASHDLASPIYEGNANFIQHGEHDALRYLEDLHLKGGVLTRTYLGDVIPALTDRPTFVGDCLWSQPGCFTRAHEAQALFDGRMAPAAARRFVRQSGARFVLADCGTRADLRPALGSLLERVTRFGCATVYQLIAPGPAQEPLAQSPGHAALRAARRQ